MIDDLKFIHEKDKSDALGLAAKEWQQLLAEYKIEPALKTDYVYNVVFAGMGGSALSAFLSRTWPTIKEPFEVVRGYDLPSYVDGDTLFIASSYSGNTEEELSCLEQAEKAGAQIVVMSSGGQLVEIAKAKNYPLVLIPSHMQPRYATLYSYSALIRILESAGLVDEGSADKELSKAAKFLEVSVKSWLPEVHTKENPAKELAKDIVGTSLVVYSGPLLAPAAYKWKISLNENAKNLAWWGTYPEFNHNEFIGWIGQPHDKPYSVIDLKSSFEHPQVLKRFELSARLLSGRRPASHVVEARGETLLEQLLWTVVFGDFVSIYLALLNGIDPTPVDLMDRFKKEIA
jgi:glucose/mannose-6-phosphate isomerase